jgi:predicted RNA-binding Zn-ribbon protein involved in translation (DUF1610 family)
MLSILSQISASRCGKKVAYRSSYRAATVAQAATERAGHLILAYECPDCGKFHIGKASETDRKVFESTGWYKQMEKESQDLAMKILRNTSAKPQEPPQQDFDT